MTIVCALSRNQAAQIARTLNLGDEHLDWAFVGGPGSAGYFAPGRIIACYEEGLEAAGASRYALTLLAVEQVARRARIEIEWVDANGLAASNPRVFSGLRGKAPLK